MIDYGLEVVLAPLEQVPMYKLFEWRNDYRVWRFCRQYDLLSWGQHEAWAEGIKLDPKVKMYAIQQKSGLEKNVGVCGLTNLDLVNRNAEFSLYIAPDFRREGHGKEALKLLISHGFNAYGLQVIWGESFEHNPATHLFVDIGFTRDGVRRNFYYREGKFIDAHLFSIVRNEWNDSEVFKKCRSQVFA